MQLSAQAYAAPQLNADRGFDDEVYGFGSGVFFVGYMVRIGMIPVSLCARHCSPKSVTFHCKQQSLANIIPPAARFREKLSPMLCFS